MIPAATDALSVAPVDATVRALNALGGVAPWSIVMAVVIGAGVGIVAGAYPATRAAKLDPIFAMRQE